MLTCMCREMTIKNSNIYVYTYMYIRIYIYIIYSHPQAAAADAAPDLVAAVEGAREAFEAGRGR